MPTRAPTAAPPAPTEVVLPAPAGATPVADNLLQPRGLTFGPDGALYIAEAGIAPPPGQDAANTGRLTRIAPDGTRTVLLDQIATTGSEFNGALGASATVIISDTIYLATAGPDGGRGNAKSGIYKVNADSTTELIADLGEFNDANKPENIDSDYDRANPYDIAAIDGKIYIADGNVQVINEVDPLAPLGQNVRRVADMSRGHPVLTGLVAGADGHLYVTQFTHGPYTEAFSKGVAQIFRVTVDGEVTPIASGLTMALGLAQSPDGTFYASQFSSNLNTRGEFTEPGSIVQLREGDSNAATLVPNLAYPTGLEWGPDGYLYFSVYGITIPWNGPQRGAVYKIQP
jgi:sugar lactone lactonase YvrE